MSDTPKYQFTAIVAMDANRTIGNGGALPWPRCSPDMKFFRSMTMSHPLIMGRKTFESIVAETGAPLPNRHNIVMTRNLRSDSEFCRAWTNYPGRVTVVGGDLMTPSGLPAIFRQDSVYSLADQKIYEDGTEFQVIGGGEIYKALLPWTNKLIITHLEGEFEGDVKFPEFEYKFEKKETILVIADDATGLRGEVVLYERPADA